MRNHSVRQDSLKWVWIDLDDTLIDFRANSRIALRLLYEKMALSRFYACCDDWIDAYEKNNKSLWDRYNRAEITKDFLRIERMRAVIADAWQGGSDDLVNLSWEMDRVYLALLAEQKTLVEGARELLDYLRDRKYNIGVLSNGFSQVQHLKIASAGLTGKIDLVILSDDIGVNKPDRRIYDYAMEKAGCPDPEAHVMIGDNPDTDIAGAVAVGWGAIYFNRGKAGAPVMHEQFVEIGSLSSVISLL